MKDFIKNMSFLVAGATGATIFIYNYTQNDLWHRMANGFFLIFGVVFGSICLTLLTLIIISYGNKKNR
jgi:hypothetical protein